MKLYAKNILKNNRIWPSHFTLCRAGHAGPIFTIIGVWRVVSYRRLNHPCEILRRLVKGLGATAAQHRATLWTAKIPSSGRGRCKASPIKSPLRVCRITDYEILAHRHCSTVVFSLNWRNIINIQQSVSPQQGRFSCSSLGGPVEWPHLRLGGGRISDDIMHDWVNGVIWHQLCNATL